MKDASKLGFKRQRYQDDTYLVYDKIKRTETLDNLDQCYVPCASLPSLNFLFKPTIYYRVKK